jgi:hypothetical protein
MIRLRFFYALQPIYLYCAVRFTFFFTLIGHLIDFLSGVLFQLYFNVFINSNCVVYLILLVLFFMQEIPLEFSHQKARVFLYISEFHSKIIFK